MTLFSPMRNLADPRSSPGEVSRAAVVITQGLLSAVAKASYMWLYIHGLALAILNTHSRGGAVHGVVPGCLLYTLLW